MCVEFQALWDVWQRATQSGGIHPRQEVCVYSNWFVTYSVNLSVFKRLKRHANAFSLFSISFSIVLFFYYYWPFSFLHSFFIYIFIFWPFLTISSLHLHLQLFVSCPFAPFPATSSYCRFHLPFLSSKKKLAVIYGKWTECMWSVDPQAYEAHKKSEKKGDNKKQKNVRTCATNILHLQ